MKTIGKTSIPTATGSGREGYAFNPVVGCKRCKKGKCGADGFTCWAAAYMRRFAKKWAEWESNEPWPKGRVPINPFNHAETERRLQGFMPCPLSFQFGKDFPKKSSIIAVGWMSDVCYWERDWIDAVLTKIRKDNLDRSEKGLPLHIFQFLTKEPLVYGERLFPENCWLGVTATTQEEYNQRMWTANADGAKGGHSVGQTNRKSCKYFVYLEPLKEEIFLRLNEFSRKLDWVIAGGQNGPGAKPVPLGWFREIRDQCHVSGIPFFFKGHGEWRPWEYTPDQNNENKTTITIDFGGNAFSPNPGIMIKVKDDHSHLLDGVELRQFPEVVR